MANLTYWENIKNMTGTFSCPNDQKEMVDMDIDEEGVIDVETWVDHGGGVRFTTSIRELKQIVELWENRKDDPEKVD